MKIILIASLLTASLMLGACVKSNPAKTKVYTPAGTYEYHCPPGQRKKGRC